MRVGGNTAGVAVRWAAGSDDEAVDHYEIERNGQIVGSTPGLGFDDFGVTALTTVGYRVVTVDTSGNRGPSLPVNAVAGRRDAAVRRAGPQAQRARRPGDGVVGRRRATTAGSAPIGSCATARSSAT